MHQATTKGMLLDQQGVFCGIGNWIADEVCYQAGVHPAAAGDSLSVGQLRAVYDAVLYVCGTAVAVWDSLKLELWRFRNTFRS